MLQKQTFFVLVLIVISGSLLQAHQKQTTYKKTQKRALIFGVTGQDGAYLSEFLLDKGYEVHGIKRRSSSFNTERIDHLIEEPQKTHKKHSFFLHYGDITDSTNVLRLIREIEPDEIYNLAAQSHVAVSFETPEYTAQTDALGTLRILEAIRALGLADKIKFYQASTSELFGNRQVTPQNELTPFYPCSPYAAAKLYGYWITVNYREAYGIFACNGILFNHESQQRGETFVTRKITRAVARIKYGLQDVLYLGNMNSMRDWGHAQDYVEAMWLMLQQDKPDDYVIATGETHTVREFVQKAFKEAGIDVVWRGTGITEHGINKETGKIIVATDHRYFRPSDVNLLLGDATKARSLLGWKPKVTFDELVKLMVHHDCKRVKQKIDINGLKK